MRKLLITSLVCGTMVMAHPIIAAVQEKNANTVETEVKKEVIPFQTKYVFNRDITPGRVKKVTDGKDGSKTITITRTLEEGKVTDTKKEQKIDPAVDAVFHMGRSGLQLTDRGTFTRAKVVTMQSTAYLPSDGSGTGRTASGLQAKHGIVAVDPKVIKIGTLVFVEGYGLAVAADTGGAIKGNKIDVCIQSRSEAMKWGRRKVKVHIFTDRHTAGMAKKYR